MSQNQSEPYAYISKGNSIQYVKIEETNNIDIFDNEENTFSADENVDIPYCTKTRLQTCDIITTQVKTNYSGVSARIRNSKGLDQELSVVKRTIDMSLLSYDVYEFKINFSNYEEGTYDVVVKFSDGNFGDQYFQSENIDLKELHEGTVHIRYYDESNGDIFYTYGLKNVGNILRVPLVDLSLKDNQESQISEGDNSTVMVMSEVYEQVQFFFDCVTGKYLRALVIALSSENLFLNNVGYVKQEELEAEILGRTNIYESNVLLNKSGVDFIPPIPGKIMDIDLYRYTSINRIFTVYPDDKIYFFGTGSNVSIGDKLAFDESGENILTGNDNYFGISNTEWVQVDENGIVIDKGLILEEVPFIMEIIIPNDGDAFKLESVGNSVWKVQGGQDAVVDWGDGTTSQLDDSNVGGNSFGVEKSYSASGTYQVKISGRLTALTVTDTGDKIIKISQWGDLGLLRYALKLGNLTDLPQGAITGFYGTKRGSKYNDEPISDTTPDTFQINLYDTYSIEYLPNNFLNFLKFEDIGYGVFMGIFYKNCYKLKNIPEDFFQGVLVATGSNYLFQDCYALEYLPPDLLNNSYGFKQDISRFFMSNAGRNYLGDPSKTLVLDENFFSNVNLGNKTNFGFTLIGWNIDNVPKNLFKNSLGSIANGGDGVLQVYPLFYNCTKLTELPDDLFKDFQLSKDMASSIRNTSITHVKSSWLGGTVQNNDISFREFARGGIVDTIDEDFFDYFPNTIDLRLAFENNEIVTFPNNTFRNLPKVTTFAQTFANNPLVSIPQDAFKESVNVSTLSSMFSDTNITSVPSDLFKDFTEVVYAGGIFFQCYQLSDIPVGLFDDMTKNNSFHRTFYRCNSLTLIPNNLFDNNQEFCDFSSVFEECNSLVTVPDLLFQNTKPTTIEFIFEGCSSLKTISLDIFNVISDKTQIKEVFSAFEESGLEISITKDMFEGFTLPNNRRNVEGVFGGTKIKYVCKELFQDIPVITNVFSLFKDCNELTTIEDGFLQNQITQITTIGNLFKQCVSLSNFDAYSWGKNLPNQLLEARSFMSRNSVQTGVLPRLWFNRPDPTNRREEAFTACYNAPNYPEVPLDWGGEIGSSRLGFYIDTTPFANLNDLVDGDNYSWLTHNGLNEELSVGDTVYLDYESSNVFQGGSNWYSIGEDEFAQIDDNGVAIMVNTNIRIGNLANIIESGGSLRTYDQDFMTRFCNYAEVTNYQYDNGDVVFRVKENYVIGGGFDRFYQEQITSFIDYQGLCTKTNGRNTGSAIFRDTLLSEVYLPNVITIGFWDFYDCDSLISLDFPKLEETLNGSFGNCSNLKSVEAPELKTIGDNSFLGCSSLEKAEYPKAETIGSSAFNSCVNLESTLDFPLITRLEASVFRICPKVTSVNFPNVTYIGSQALRGTSVVSFSFPDVTEIVGATNTNSAVFQDSQFLETFYAPKLEKMTNGFAFINCPQMSLFDAKNLSEMTGDYSQNFDTDSSYMRLNVGRALETSDNGQPNINIQQALNYGYDVFYYPQENDPVEILTFGLASRIPQGVNLVIDRTIGQGVVTQQISYRQTGTTNFLLGASTTDRLTIMTQTGLISSQTYDFQLTLIDDNETVVSDIITVSIQ